VLLNATLSGAGKAVQLVNDLRDVLIAQNTFVDVQDARATGSLAFDQAPGTGPTVALQVRSNVFGAAVYPVIGNGTANPVSTFARYAPDGVLTGNAFVGVTGIGFPAGNVFPTAMSLIMSGLGSADYHVDLPAQLLAVLGATPGVDWIALATATAGVVRE
jgi:hypothetical protein